MAKSSDKKKRRMMFEFVQIGQIFKMNGVPFTRIEPFTHDTGMVNAVNVINNEFVFIEDIVYVQPTSAKFE